MENGSEKTPAAISKLKWCFLRLLFVLVSPHLNLIFIPYINTLIRVLYTSKVLNEY